MITREQAVNPENTEFHSSLRHNKAGTCEKWRRNGQTKTWKTMTEGFILPVKYGLRSYYGITDINADEFHLASECPLTVAVVRDVRF
jgi:hypothetical protein